MKEAIVLAGGFGTRLRQVVSDVPKPMAPVNGRPFLTYVLDHLALYGVSRVILSTGYQHKAIKDYFGHSYQKIHLEYSQETEPLGTGGAILKAVDLVDAENVFVLNGDSLFRFDLAGFARFHLRHNSFSIALTKITNTARYGRIEITSDGRIIKFNEKNRSTAPGYINSGVYIFNVPVFKKIGLPKVFSVERDFFHLFLKLLEIYGFEAEGYFIDIGVPQDYARAQNDL